VWNQYFQYIPYMMKVKRIDLAHISFGTKNIGVTRCSIFFDFHLWNMESIGFTCNLVFIANFHVLHLKKFYANFFFHLSGGVAAVAVRALVEICINDISVVRLQIWDLGYPSSFGLDFKMLKSLEQTQE
jgi:hypothetical protein